ILRSGRLPRGPDLAVNTRGLGPGVRSVGHDSDSVRTWQDRIGIMSHTCKNPFANSRNYLHRGRPRGYSPRGAQLKSWCRHRIGVISKVTPQGEPGFAYLAMSREDLAR